MREAEEIERKNQGRDMERDRAERNRETEIDEERDGETEMKDTHRDTGDRHRYTSAQTHACRHTDPMSSAHHSYTLDPPLFLSLGCSRGLWGKGGT